METRRVSSSDRENVMDMLMDMPNCYEHAALSHGQPYGFESFTSMENTDPGLVRTVRLCVVVHLE